MSSGTHSASWTRLLGCCAALAILVSERSVAQTGTCCTANFTPGCNNASCQIAICGADAFCCTVEWDAFCATDATANANAGGACAGVSNCPGTPPPPPPGCTNYSITITGGSFPAEVSWQVIGPGGVVASGIAPSTTTVCLGDGCYAMHMYDSFGDGWNGATFTVRVQPSNAIVASGTLNSGTYGTALMALGSGCDVVTASDCADAVNVCTDLSFQIDPNGFGTVNEIPPLGTVGNPDYGMFNYNPWGTLNLGCLRAGELNSTWMVVNIWQSGWLEFTFGGLGTQAGFYDWAMWPYGPNTCAQIPAGGIAPVRCNWNGVSYGGTGLAQTPPAGASPTNFEPPIWAEAGQQYLICFSNWSSVSTGVPLAFSNGPGNAIVDCQDVTLPVELTAFHAQQTGAAVLLRWTTASERESKYFEVERSHDLENWVAIGSLDAAGSSAQPIDYLMRDPAPLPGNNYYRLNMVDTDGSQEHSPVREVWLHEREPAAYPNPSAGSIWVRRAGEHVTLEVIDGLGRSVPYMLLEAGETLLHVDLGQEAIGLYTLKLRAGSATYTERVLVQPR